MLTVSIEEMFINEENKKQVLDKIEKVFNSLQDRQKSLISDILTIKLYLENESRWQPIVSREYQNCYEKMYVNRGWK